MVGLIGSFIIAFEYYSVNRNINNVINILVSAEIGNLCDSIMG